MATGGTVQAPAQSQRPHQGDEVAMADAADGPRAEALRRATAPHLSSAYGIDDIVSHRSRRSVSCRIPSARLELRGAGPAGAPGRRTSTRFRRPGPLRALFPPIARAGARHVDPTSHSGRRRVQRWSHTIRRDVAARALPRAAQRCELVRTGLAPGRALRSAAADRFGVAVNPRTCVGPRSSDSGRWRARVHRQVRCRLDDRSTASHEHDVLRALARQFRVAAGHRAASARLVRGPVGETLVTDAFTGDPASTTLTPEVISWLAKCRRGHLSS